MTDLFDIVICVGPNDNEVIQSQLPFTQKNIIGFRNIYLVVADSNLKIENCITVDEKVFPFNIVEIMNMGGSGWYLQQLLKLYAGFVIPDILDRYLVIDSDTYFLQPTNFVQDSKCIFDIGIEYNLPYFTHMQKLHPSLIRYLKYVSGIAHHMIFERKYIQELFDLVEIYHTTKEEKIPFYKIFLNSVDDFKVSGASEYEIYFNYMMIYHKKQVKVRCLKWKNVDSENFYQITKKNENNLAFISWHWYKR